MSPHQRRSAENGIWLCQNCGKLVDNDAVTFPVELLRKWKSEAEDRARSVQGKAVGSVGWALATPWSAANSATTFAAFTSEIEALSRTVAEADRARTEALLALAREHLDRGQFTLARDEYLRLLADPVVAGFPDLAFKIRNNLALAARALGNSAEALENSEAALAANPTNDIARLTLLGTLAAFELPGWKEQFIREREWLETTTVGLQFLSTMAFDEDRLEDVLAYAERALQMDQANHAARFNKALALVRLQRIDDAIRTLEEIPADSVLALPARVRKAELLYERARRGDAVEASLRGARASIANVEELASAKSLSDSDWRESLVHCVSCKAGIETVTGQPQAALALLAKLDGHVSFPGPHHFNKAQALAAIGDWSAAIGELTAAAASDPTEAAYTMWLAAAHTARFSQSRDLADIKEAERLLRQVLATSPTGLAVLNLVEILVKTNRALEAAELIDEAIRLLPGDPEVRVARLMLFRRTGRLDEADVAAREIHQVDKTEPIAATHLGLRSFSDGEFATALAYFDDAISNPFCWSTDLLDAIVFRARCLKRLGRLDEAIEFTSGPRARSYLGDGAGRLFDELTDKAR